jgi:phosphatidylserine decarboxylase
VYCRNERVVIRGNSDYGDFVIVFVGATNVGKIKIHCEKRIKTNSWFAKIRQFDYENPIYIKKGTELGLFEVGSTVILFLDNEILNNVIHNIDDTVKMGESLLINNL